MAEDENGRWVRITTNDGFSFIVDRKVALASTHFADALKNESGFSESASSTCTLDLRASVAQVVIEYYAYKAQWTGFRGQIPDFTSRIPTELVLELMAAAHYLQP